MAPSMSMFNYGSRFAMKATRPALKRLYNTSMTQTVTNAPWATKILGGGACVGLGALCAYGLSQPAQYVPAETRNFMASMGGEAFAKRTRSRIMKTYGYLSTGLAMTAGVAVAAYRTPLAGKIMRMNPWMFMGVSLFGCMGSMIACQMADYNSPMKLPLWATFNACQGLSLIPIGMLGGPIVAQAAMITACIVGSLSAVAAVSPGDQFLSMGPALGCGLGVVVAASLGSMFFPGSGLLMNVSLYGGLGLFGLFVCYDTQKILAHAQMDRHYDPINREIGIYIHTINIFIRVAQILAMNQRRK